MRHIINDELNQSHMRHDTIAALYAPLPLPVVVLMVDDVGGVVGLEYLAGEGVGALGIGASVVEGGVAPLVRGVHVTAFG